MCLIFWFHLVAMFVILQRIYKDIKAVVDGEVFIVGLIIPKQYNLTRL